MDVKNIFSENILILLVLIIIILIFFRVQLVKFYNFLKNLILLIKPNFEYIYL